MTAELTTATPTSTPATITPEKANQTIHPSNNSNSNINKQATLVSSTINLKRSNTLSSNKMEGNRNTNTMKPDKQKVTIATEHHPGRTNTFTTMNSNNINISYFSSVTNTSTVITNNNNRYDYIIKAIQLKTSEKYM